VLGAEERNDRAAVVPDRRCGLSGVELVGRHDERLTAGLEIVTEPSHDDTMRPRQPTAYASNRSPSGSIAIDGDIPAPITRTVGVPAFAFAVALAFAVAIAFAVALPSSFALLGAHESPRSFHVVAPSRPNIRASRRGSVARPFPMHGRAIPRPPTKRQSFVIPKGSAASWSPPVR
jgi:hypothetical protein